MTMCLGPVTTRYSARPPTLSQSQQVKDKQGKNVMHACIRFAWSDAKVTAGG